MTSDEPGRGLEVGTAHCRCLEEQENLWVISSGEVMQELT